MNTVQLPTRDSKAAALDALIEHIARYRLTVFPAVRSLPAFATVPPARIKDLLKDARQRQLVDAAQLHDGISYWHLSSAGAAKCGSNARFGPLSEPAKLRAYAVLRFCCLSEQPRHRLLPGELRRHFPELDRPGLPSGYYLDPTGPKRLGFLRVDAGHRGRWDRILQTLRDDIRDHASQSAFTRLVRAERFELTVLTVFRSKAERIKECLASLREAKSVPVKVAAIPELLPLIKGTH
jgi:hypothetical protein